MKKMKLIFYAVIVLCLVNIVIALPTFVPAEPTQSHTTETGGGITLQPPAFFKTAHAQDAELSVCTPDLLSDAGVMAYVNLQTELDVASLSSFDSVEEQTEQYIKGSFLPPGFETVPEYDEAAYVQVLVCSDGWIVAYLPKDQLAAALLDWANYAQRKLTKTPIEDAIDKVTKELGLSLSASPSNAINYYDVRYPNATGIKLVADSISRTTNQNLSEDFQITIPKKLHVYELSWSHVLFGLSGSYLASSECKLDEITFSGFQSPGEKTWLRSIKVFDKPESMVTKEHTFLLTLFNAGSSYCGIAIVYGEADQ